ncbi:MAG: hypothetical protein MUP17_12785 [candidate division Zixibacteria bacterium]|nr:hypothetical protein [candidate division Zixibacteria bacterium]
MIEEDLETPLTNMINRGILNDFSKVIDIAQKLIDKIEELMIVLQKVISALEKKEEK